MALTRRDFVGLAAASVLARPALAQMASLLTRAIPASGERIPAVGLGTAYVFDRDGDKTRREAAEVVKALLDGGGRLIDTASSYGDAEEVLGQVIAPAGSRDKLFIATKLEEPDTG